MNLTFPYNFNLRSYQKEVRQARLKGYRYFITVWHRRAGKDIFWLNFLIEEAFKRVGTYFYIMDTYRHAKLVAWEGLDDDGKTFLFSHLPVEVIQGRNETELRVELINGSKIQLIGSDNIDRVVGSNPVGLVFSEFSIQSPSAWDFLRPIILAEGNKGWAAFNFTPRGENHAKKLWDNAVAHPETWFSSIKTIEDTARDAVGEKGGRVVTDDSIEVLRAEGKEEDFIQQEFYCSFNGVRAGSYYAPQLLAMQDEVRYTDVPWDPSVPVFTAWDLGIADAMAVIYAQWHGEMLHIIDYEECTGEGLQQVIPRVRGRAYTYSNHYAPHDIKQRELVSGRSRLEAAQDLGIPFRIVPDMSVQDGIDSVRRMLSMVRIDKRNCAKLFGHLGQYHKEYDEKTNTFGDKPVHDSSSHGADAARYLSIIFDQERPERFAEVKVSGLHSNPIDDSDPDENEGLDTRSGLW